MDIQKVGGVIASLRRGIGLTQAELGERVGVTFQAVSRWERGESLPDTAILPDLAKVLDTTVDYILTGGEAAVGFKGRVSVSDMIEGVGCLRRMRDLLGCDNIIYRSAVEGINRSLNTDIESALENEYAFEAFVAEAVICALTSGAYVSPTDVKNSMKTEHFKNIVLGFCDRYGIK